MKLKIPILLGCAHALNDFLSGYVLASYTSELSTDVSFTMLVLYSALAFAGQIPVGLWLDKQPNHKRATLLALVILMLGALLTYNKSPLLPVIIIGIASALLHVAGGTWVLKIAPNKSGITGIFVAPGVAGLSLGGFLGTQQLMHIPLFVFIGTFLLLSAIWMASRKDVEPTQDYISQTNTAFERHDALMLLILAAICLRSLLWDMINLFYADSNHLLLLAIGISAFFGKILGGFLSDIFGWKKWLRISLPLAALLLSFFGENAVALCIGAALLQSTTPMMVQLMYSAFPRQPAIAVALSLGLAIILAGIPTFLPVFTQHLSIVFLSLCAVLPLYGWWLIRRVN